MIKKNDRIADLIKEKPNLEEIFQKNNIKIHGWGSMANNRIGDAARKKGIDVNNLINELNQFVRKH